MFGPTKKKQFGVVLIIKQLQLELFCPKRLQLFFIFTQFINIIFTQFINICTLHMLLNIYMCVLVNIYTN
jgi:hypothetical protein